jgi:hypothetical protein
MLIQISYLCENYLYNGVEDRNICKHVVERYTIYLIILIQRDCIREKRLTILCEQILIQYFISLTTCNTYNTQSSQYIH